MARTITQIIAPQQLSNSVTVLYTTPENRDTVITRITFTNTGTVDRFVNLWLVPNGGSAVDENKILDAVNVAAGETFSAADVEGQVLPAQNTVRGNAETAGTITVIGSGTEVTR